MKCLQPTGSVWNMDEQLYAGFAAHGVVHGSEG